VRFSRNFRFFNPQAEYGGVVLMWCERRPSTPLIALASIVSAPGLVGWQLAETIACNQAVTGENKSELSELIQGFRPERDPLPAFRDSFQASPAELANRDNVRPVGVV
jgi:hypothetical protein